ncbi:MAG TPA: electron transfer flavoprotein subunit beta/FixA family protein [Deltaproteobacteria bacterium]|nr:electron transfer flavoprotein subunit beta/FixA family protein [Deltaproteobacteria bacterium]
MKILVCIKEVYDSPETLVFDESAGRVTFGPHTVFRMNRYDEYALEEALRIRERLSSAVVDAISVGSPRVSRIIRRALEMGANHGIHVQTPGETCLSAFERAHLIASAARGRGYDLVLAGVMAEDDMESQVGPLLAAVLEYGCATGVIFEEISADGSRVAVEREVEGGSRECLTLALPCVLTIQSGINTPRYPALSHVLRARSSELECIEASGLAAPPPTQGLVRILPPAQGRQGEVIEGAAVEKADKLIRILREHSLLPR